MICDFTFKNVIKSKACLYVHRESRKGKTFLLGEEMQCPTCGNTYQYIWQPGGKRGRDGTPIVWQNMIDQDLYQNYLKEKNVSSTTRTQTTRPKSNGRQCEGLSGWLDTPVV